MSTFRYEILSGKLPFTTKIILDLLEEKRRFTISKSTLPHVSDNFIYILERMTKFDPSERIDVEQVLYESSRLMNNLSIPK